MRILASSVLSLVCLASVALAADAKREPEPPAAAEPAPAEPAAPAGPDRSHPPAVATPPVLELPEPVAHDLHPGVTAWHVQVPGVRKVSVQVVFDRGSVELLRGPTMVSRATGWLADAAGGGLDGSAFSEQADLHQVEVSSSWGLHDGRVALMVPKEELTAGLDLQTKIVREAAFPKQEVVRWGLDQNQYYLVQGPSSPDSLASAALSFGWFEAAHPYGARPDLNELGLVNTKALQATWSRVVHESPITVLVVGDVSWAEVEPSLKAMTNGLGKAADPATELLFDPPTKTRILAVDLPGQPQAVIRARLAAPARDTEDQAEMRVANWVLGGHFLSRLNANLREEKGWTYGTWSGYQTGSTYGHTTIGVDVKVENAGATIAEIEAELARLTSAPVTADELEAAHRSLVADWNRTLETADSAVATYYAALDQHKSAADLRARQERVYAVTAEELQKVAATWYAADRARLWVVVGDRKQLEPQLAGLGTVEWVAPNDVVLGKL